MRELVQRVSPIATWLRRWIAQPAFADEEKTRTAALMKMALLATTGLWMSLLLAQPIAYVVLRKTSGGATSGS